MLDIDISSEFAILQGLNSHLIIFHSVMPSGKEYLFKESYWTAPYLIDIEFYNHLYGTIYTYGEIDH